MKQAQLYILTEMTIGQTDFSVHITNSQRQATIPSMYQFMMH